MDLVGRVKKEILLRLSLHDVDSMETYFTGKFSLLGTYHDEGLISDSEIEESLKAAVFYKAKGAYQHLIGKNDLNLKTPDDLKRPECFAYGLKYSDFFDKKMIKKIKFRDGDSAKNFIKRYKKRDLIKSLRIELMSARKKAL